MTVPYAFANLSGSIALAKLDSNFNTPITIGNTSVQLGNTITTINNITLANVTITSGTSNVTNVNVTNINVTNVTATLANVTTLNVASEYVTASNVATAVIGNLTLSNALTVPNGGTGRVTLPVNNVLLGNGTGSIASVAPGNAGNVLTSIGGVWVSNAAVVANSVTNVTATSPVISSGGTTPNLSFIASGTAGNVLTSIGGVWVSNAAVTTSAGGLTTQVQYNSGGSFAGSANLTFDGNNVGIGTSPAAMFSSARALQLGAGTILEGRSASATVSTLSSNQYINTSSARTYITTDFASYYAQINGQHQFYTAPSGTAGTTATFTQVLALNKDQTVALQGASLSNGTGISFPATQSASSDANTLDDYEEGTWTPTIAFGGNSVGVTYNAGTAARYTKIGRFVLLNGYLLLTNKGSSTGIATISNLPFAIANSGENGDTSSALGYAGNITYTGTLGLWFGSTANPRFVATSSGAGITNLTDTAFANTSECIFSLVYTTA